MKSEKNSIKALGVFLLFGSLMAFLAAITLLFPNTFLTSIWKINPTAHEELLPFARIAGIGFILFTPILIGAATGIFKFKKWGWKLAVLIIGGNAIGDIFNVIRGEPIKGLAGLLIAGCLLIYLFRPNIKGHFK